MTNTYSVFNLLAEPEYVQKIVLRDYLRSLADAAASEARTLECDAVINYTRIWKLRELRTRLRLFASLVA
jgi:hypothetical protein